MNPKYRSTRPEVAEIIRLANKFLDAACCAEDDAEELINLAHKIGSQSFGPNFPSNTLLGSLTLLMQDQSIDFALIGGVAVSVHGLMRDTEDIDALVSKLPDMTDSEYAAKFGFYRARSRTGTVMTIDHKQSGYVELLLANDPLREYSIKTAGPANILGYQVPVASPIAMIGLKIKAMVNNPARENKDRIDIMNIATSKRLSFAEVFAAISEFLSEEENGKLKEVLKP